MKITWRQFLYKVKGNTRIENDPIPMSLSPLFSHYPLTTKARVVGFTHLIPNLSLLMGARGCNHPTLLPSPMSEEFTSSTRTWIQGFRCENGMGRGSQGSKLTGSYCSLPSSSSPSCSPQRTFHSFIHSINVIEHIFYASTFRDIAKNKLSTCSLFCNGRDRNKCINVQCNLRYPYKWEVKEWWVWEGTERLSS